MTQEEKDLCKTCKYYWTDFPLPLDHVVPHCEILDKKKGLSADMDNEVSYPCLECPFNCYTRKENKV